MVRVITQETYDEVVSENIEEFDMTPEEAIKEAIAQFEAQGVDLSNIIKDLSLGSGDGHGVSNTVKKLKELINQSQSDELILNELDALRTECNKDIARRVRAGKDGAYNILIDLLESRLTKYLENKSNDDEKMIVSVLNTFVALMDVQPDLLEQRGIDVIKRILDNVDSEDIIVETLKWIGVCCVKHEMNRQRLFAMKIVGNLKTLITERANPRVLKETSQVIRKFTLDDDVRVEFGKAHDHAKEMGVQLLDRLTKLLKEHPVPPTVTSLLPAVSALLVRHELCAAAADAGASHAVFHILAQHMGDAAVVLLATKLRTPLPIHSVVSQCVEHPVPPTVTSLLPAVSALLVRHELCAAAADAGASHAVFHILAQHMGDAAVVLLATKLIVALAGNDDVKRNLMKAGIAPIIVLLMNQHSSNGTVAAILLKCVSALTLREPSHSTVFFDCGAPEAIIQCIKEHPDNANVQKNGCWAIRNMVARCREQNPRFHELDAEALLTAAHKRFEKEFGFDIKSALRDLECDVKMDEQWTGKGVQMTND